MNGTSGGYALERTSAASMPLFWDQEVSGSIPPAPTKLASDRTAVTVGIEPG